MRRKLMIWLAAVPVMGWAMFGLLGHPAARMAAAALGARMLKLGDGKFTNPDRFIELRLRDLLVLLTMACFLTLVQMLVISVVNRGRSPRTRWIVSSLAAFIGLNLFAAVAGQTVLFWCLLFTGKGRTHNYTQFQIKRGLMKEVEAPRQAVLLGSSQTRAQIDERLLNDRLGKGVWTTELSFPGNRAYELVSTLEALPPVKIDFVLCYLSETYFYFGAESEALPYFTGCRNLAEFWQLGGREVNVGRGLAYGLLGGVVPLFLQRDPLAGRILGSKLMYLKQEEYGQTLSASLDERAKATAPKYRVGKESDFQKRAFSLFARKCRDRGSRLIVCCGQLNPILGQVLDPVLRRDMIAFLADEAAHDDNMVLLDESDLPKQAAADYDDLTHVNDAAQARFTEFIAGVLESGAKRVPRAR